MCYFCQCRQLSWHWQQIEPKLQCVQRHNSREPGRQRVGRVRWLYGDLMQQGTALPTWPTAVINGGRGGEREGTIVVGLVALIALSKRWQIIKVRAYGRHCCHWHSCHTKRAAEERE